MNSPFMNRGPSKTKEFLRVQGLPRRDLRGREGIEALRDELTELLKTPQGTQKLFIIQALAIVEIAENRGSIVPIGVGGGKTLVTQMAPVFMDALRPLLLVPASLRDQTNDVVLPELSKHWRLHPNMIVFSYESLSLKKYANFLEDLKPDMIVCDECHFLKNLQKSGRVKRLSRYMSKNPNTIFVPLSGTIAKRSVMDYWHLSQWALKPENTPMPTNWTEAKHWANALDMNVRPGDRCAPGALMDLMGPDDENFRQGYRRRFLETPGVVSSPPEKLGVALSVNYAKCPDVPQELKETINRVISEEEDPHGNLLMFKWDVSRIVKQLVQGFFLKWKHPGPIPWMQARSEFSKALNRKLKHNRLNLDTEGQVMDYFEENPIPEYERWIAIKDTFKPKTIPVWVDDYLVTYAAEWLNKTAGICWVQNPDVGERIAELSGFYYSGEGDKHILTCPSQPIIASIAAHGTGRNLQDRWHQNLVVSPPSCGAVWEQLLGRTHRHGQEQDRVLFEVCLHHYINKNNMAKALHDANGYSDRGEGETQRLLYCDRQVLQDTEI